jgi:hypothetical protein
MFVFTRQPWMMGSDNLLLEWVDPNDEDKQERITNLIISVSL